MAILLPKTLVDMQKIGQVGLPVNDFTGGAYLASTDFPNQDFLYGWQAPDTDSATWTDLGGNGKDLTRIGPLQIANDMLGNSKACDFDGTQDSLYSVDGAFAFTGTFSVGLWIYREDWSQKFGKLTGTNEIFISRWSTTGWQFIGQDNSTNIEFYTSTTNGIAACGSLLPGWHFFSVVRTSGSNTKIFIDGTLAMVGTASTITSTGRLEVGSYATGTRKFKGAFQDIWVHNGTAWTDAQVLSIYSKAAANYQPQMFAGHSQPATIVEPNLASSEVLAQYSFNSGALTTDDKGTYALTNVGTVAESAGIFGGTSGAAYFNGTSQYFTQSTLLGTIPSSVAISFWFRAVKGVPAANQALFWKTGDVAVSNDWTGILITTTGKLFGYNYVNGTSYDVYSQTILPNGPTSWYHIVYTWDTANGLRMWVNGILEGGNSSATTLWTGDQYDFAIGVRVSGTPDLYFNGWIAQFKVMNKILTQADVDILYSSKIALPEPLKGKDVQLEASYRPNGIEAFEKNLNLDGIVVGSDSENIYRAGLNNGSGLTSKDSLKIKGRF